jgi:hypothetical protein
MTSILFLAAIAASASTGSAHAPLEAGATAFAGTTVAVDPRLAQRHCPGGFRFGWADQAGRAVEALCAVRGERLVLPLAALPSPSPAGGSPTARLRRGDPLTAEVEGAGFRVTAAAVATGADRAGDVQARNSRSGSILRGQLGSDGRLRVAAGALAR